MWTSWHLVSTFNGKPVCEDTTWEPLLKRRTDSLPSTVDCEKCKESKTYEQTLQDYEKLLSEIGTKKSAAKVATALVEPACFLAEKHKVPFNTVYGLMLLRDFR